MVLYCYIVIYIYNKNIKTNKYIATYTFLCIDIHMHTYTYVYIHARKRADACGECFGPLSAGLSGMATRTRSTVQCTEARRRLRRVLRPPWWPD